MLSFSESISFKLQQNEKKTEQQELANYKIIKQDTRISTEWCSAFAFNKDSTIMIAGCGIIIKVFQFQFGQLKEIQLLEGHNGYITTLYFMKLSDSFLSGSRDSQIRIWNLNKDQLWRCSMVLKNGHTHFVYQIIMNKNEDCIFSCGEDYSIKFWLQNTEWECSQTITCYSIVMWSICLNELENKLVACGGSENQTSQILINYLCSDKRWRKMQILQVEQYGFRISFINNNLIAFQPYNGSKLELIQFNFYKKCFQRYSSIIIENSINGDCYQLFPLQFNQKKQILLNKNGERVNLIRKNKSDQFVIEQSIKFDHHIIQGAMNQDGEYLVLWDRGSEEIQVRKYE